MSNGRRTPILLTVERISTRRWRARDHHNHHRQCAGFPPSRILSLDVERQLGEVGAKAQEAADQVFPRLQSEGWHYDFGPEYTSHSARPSVPSTEEVSA